MMSKVKTHFIPVLFLLTVTCAFSLSLLFCPYSRETFGHDAGIFAYIGYAVTRGVPLYTGAWDNKGPLLYIIDALGIVIHYRYGIFLLEFIALFLTLLFMYKTALFFAPRYVAAISAVLSAMPLTVTLEGGNLSEEWALPFTAAAFYFIVKFFCNRYSLRKIEMMIVGACIAAIVLLKLNIIMFIAVAVLGVIIVLVKEKQIKTLITVTLFSLAGFLIFTAPFAIWLIMTDSLSACLETAYFGAVGAFSEIPQMTRITNVFSMVFAFIQSGGFFIIILFGSVLPFYLYKTKGQGNTLKTLLIICFFGLFATLAGNSVSGEGYNHYFTSFVPVMLLPTVWFSRAVYTFLCTNNARSFAANAAVLAFAFLISMDSVAVLKGNITNNLRNGTDSYLYDPCILISDYVRANSSPDDTVQLFGDGPVVTSYYRAGRIAASNHFYFGNGRFTEEIKREFANEILRDIKEARPKILLFTEHQLWDFTQHLDDPGEFDKFLEENYTVDENNFSCFTYLRTGG